MIALLLSTALELAIVGASAADGISTEWGLRQPGMYELNPLLREPIPRYAFRVAGTVLVVTGYRELKRRKRNRAARVVAWTAIAVWGAAAANNVWRARQGGMR